MRERTEAHKAGLKARKICKAARGHEVDLTARSTNPKKYRARFQSEKTL